MITVGVDIGTSTAKAVIFKENSIISHAIITTEAEAEAAANGVIDKALDNIHLLLSDIEGTAFTASDRESISFAGNKRVAQVLALTKGVRWLWPTARTAINIGAESTFVVKFDERGRAIDFITNDKCAAGSGSFLETVSKMLKVPLENIGESSLTTTETVPLSSTCVVFAESEIVSLVHRGVSVPNILAGVHEALANRIYGMLNRIGPVEDVVVVGGMAKNTAIVKLLERKMGLNIIVPSETQIVSALGAAIIAKEKLSNR